MDISQVRIVNDCLYGEINLPVILWKIIDTKEFQRLRYIKQLGGVDYVFKDATHTRYQHSIGTAYLAGLIARQLRQQFTDINDQDIGCVQIAALCHDLGHGPFSFIFRKKVLPQLGIRSLEHKDLAYEIFKKIWMNVVKMDPKMKDVLSSKDMFFIKELIRGTSKKHPPVYKGREEIGFYQIFSNESITCDMCKFDYIARDCLQFGYFNEELFAEFKSTVKSPLIYRDENNQVKPVTGLSTNLENLRELHGNAYQHSSVNAVEHMISDAIVWADEYLSISARLFDIDFFCGLDDRILWAIKNVKYGLNPKIDDAKKVLERLDNGQYYAFAKQLKIKEWDSENIVERVAEMDHTINPQMLRKSVLRKTTTLGVIADDERMVQVFCVDPHEVYAVQCACQKFEESLQGQAQPQNI